MVIEMATGTVLDAESEKPGLIHAHAFQAIVLSETFYTARGIMRARARR